MCLSLLLFLALTREVFSVTPFGQVSPFLSPHRNKNIFKFQFDPECGRRRALPLKVTKITFITVRPPELRPTRHEK